MYILGVNISHEPSVCLLKDGEVVYYCENERLDGVKYDSHNHMRITYAQQINVLRQYTTYIDFIIFSSYGTDHDGDDVLIRRIITELANGGVDFNTSLFYKQNHHLYHATNAFYASGFDSAAALVMDGGGAWDLEYRDSYTSKKYEFPFREVETIYNCNYESPLWDKKWCHYSILDPTDENKIYWRKSPTEIYSNSLSCGELFNRMVAYYEMNDGDQGKIMGLSGHRLGMESFIERMKVRRIYEQSSQELIMDWFMEKDGESITVPGVADVIFDNFCEDEDLDMSLNAPTQDFYVLASLAHKLQEETFKHTCKLIQKTLDITGQNKIVLSGGYFLNCVNNYKYLKEFPNVEFFVDPIPHDSGTAIGAAKYAWYGISKSKEKTPFKDIYFGPNV